MSIAMGLIDGYGHNEGKAEFGNENWSSDGFSLLANANGIK